MLCCAVLARAGCSFGCLFGIWVRFEGWKDGGWQDERMGGWGMGEGDMREMGG